MVMQRVHRKWVLSRRTRPVAGESRVVPGWPPAQNEPQPRVCQRRCTLAAQGGSELRCCSALDRTVPRRPVLLSARDGSWLRRATAPPTAFRLLIPAQESPRGRGRLGIARSDPCPRHSSPDVHDLSLSGQLWTPACPIAPALGRIRKGLALSKSPCGISRGVPLWTPGPGPGPGLPETPRKSGYTVTKRTLAADGYILAPWCPSSPLPTFPRGT